MLFPINAHMNENVFEFLTGRNMGGRNIITQSTYVENNTFTRISNISQLLTNWGRVTHICVSKLTIVGSDNGLSPDRRQAII